MTAKRGSTLVIGAAVVLAAAAVVLLGWNPFAADGVHSLDEGDDGAVVEMAVGEQISVRLEGNITTGYEWQVAGFDAAVLVPVGDPEYVTSSDADGAGGIYTFRFDAVGGGETTLDLVYYRPWEAPSPDARRFTITVVVG